MSHIVQWWLQLPLTEKQIICNKYGVDSVNTTNLLSIYNKEFKIVNLVD